MSRNGHHQAKRRAGRSLEGHYSVRTQTREYGARALAFECCFRDTPGRACGLQGEWNECEWMEYRPYSQGTEKGLLDDVPVRDERSHHLLICLCVTAERFTRRLHRELKHHGRAII